MSDKKQVIIPILVFFFLFLAVSARAEFSLVEGVTPGLLCPGSTGLYTSIITNIGGSSQFTVSTSGSATSFSTSIPQGFQLGGGGSKTIYTYVSPRSTTQVGRYSLDVTVSTGGESKTLSREVNLRDCFEYSVSVVESEKSICPADTTSYEFVITNTGDFSETYKLGVEGPAKSWVTLSQSIVSIGSGERKSVFAFVNIPADALGKSDFSLVVDPSFGNTIRSYRVVIDVKPCFEFSVVPQKDFVSFCERSVESIPITIKNSGSVSNTYDLKLNGPVWANLDRDLLVLGVGESDSVNLILSPDYRATGEEIIELKVITQRGKIEAINNFKASVEQCYDVFVSIEKETDKICNSLSNNYGVSVKNTGKFAQSYRLSIDGPEWSSLDTNLVTLGVDEEVKFNLQVNPPFDAIPGDYNVKVIANAVDSDKVINTATLKLTTVSREECYKPSIGIEEDNKKIDVFYDSAATVPVVIENKGSVRADYTLSVSGTAANFVELNPASVSVEPNKAEVVYLYIAPGTQTVLGNYIASVNVRLEDTTILASDEVSISILEARVGEGVTVPEIIPEEKVGFWDRVKGFFSRLFGPREEAPEEIVEVNETVIIPEEEVNETVEEESFNLDTEERASQLLGEGESANIILNEEEHKISVDELNEEGLLIKIESDPIYATMQIGETKEIDVDGDGVNDLRITYNGILDGKADLVYEKIAIEEEEIPAEEEIPVIEEEELNETVIEREVKEFVLAIDNYELRPSEIRVSEGDKVRIVVSALDSGEGNGYGFSIDEFGVRELLEEGQTISVEFIADKAGSFEIVNTIPCEACNEDLKGTLIVGGEEVKKGGGESSLGRILVYRNYIIAAVIILIIVILLVTTKAHKKVIEFFEEEVEEEEPKEKESKEKEIKKEIKREEAKKETKKEESKDKVKKEKKEEKKEKKKPKSEDDYY